MRIIVTHCAFYETGNWIGDEGATSLSEALKVNTTLTCINLCCKYKKNCTFTKTNLIDLLFYFNRQVMTSNTMGCHRCAKH